MRFDAMRVLRRRLDPDIEIEIDNRTRPASSWSRRPTASASGEDVFMRRERN